MTEIVSHAIAEEISTFIEAFVLKSLAKLNWEQESNLLVSDGSGGPGERKPETVVSGGH